MSKKKDIRTDEMTDIQAEATASQHRSALDLLLGQRSSMPMVRVVIDLPAATPLSALHTLAQAHGCRIRRTSDGVYRLMPEPPAGDRSCR